ncbi:PAM68 family protein [Crocosphaera sp. Alani8]|uniref:PAM68 family protein n=1 Tax=Crocosphaera sp. Alani8 TaxID=3038952 RepID=UPI00313BD624
MADNSPRNSIPFEPGQKKKKKQKKTPQKVNNSFKSSQKSQKGYRDASLNAIPDSVSQRMVRRMAIFSGIPTFLGMSSFFIFYWVVSQDLLDIPNSIVGAVSFGLFGLGVLGLSYGIFSASWDENRVGSWLGWQELSQNLGRTLNAWRSTRQEAVSERERKKAESQSQK